MAYTREETSSIAELFSLIRENAEKLGHNPDYAGSWRDVPYLKELEHFTELHTEEDAAEDNAFLYDRIAEIYSNTGRCGIAAAFYTRYAQTVCALLAAVPDEEKLKKLGYAVQNISKLRNQYYGIDDGCEDIVKLVSPYLGEDKARECVEKGKERVCLRVDQVENTEDYLAVIDDIEKQLDDEFGTDMYMGKCFMIWKRKRELLHDLGIEWRSPSVLNPGVIID